jgi:hypothetical protein
MRGMPGKYSITYREVQAPITDPITKFGGQPVWLEQPQWPLSRKYGTPMQFVCQIVLLTELFGDIEGRMAYIFITDDYDTGYLADTWKPDGGENAVIIQPGGVWAGPAQSLHEGPTLYRRAWEHHDWQRTPCEFEVELRFGEDPAEGVWDDVDSDDATAWDNYFDALVEDKIGGAPVPTVNSGPKLARFPPNWRLLLQVNTKVNDEDPFFLNLASDGVGYAVLSEDGRSGKFMWSR